MADDSNQLTPDELSIVTPEQFDRAFEEYLQWGPRHSIPIEDRWPAVIPDVDRAKYVALKSKCEEIRWTTVRWADDLKYDRIKGDNQETLRKMMATKYPFLTLSRRRSLEVEAWHAAEM